MMPAHASAPTRDSSAQSATDVNDPNATIREEFRGHLQRFYAQLKLAPPYDSVEKALQQLTVSLKALPQAEQVHVAADPVLRWRQFTEAFAASGLSKKHRGIIAGLARNRAAVDLPEEYDHFLRLFSE
jgi:hypothetical protein